MAVRPRKLVIQALGVEALAASIFYALYSGADRLAAARGFTVPVHFAWELEVPFVAAALPVYLSLWLLLLLAPWRLSSIAEVRAMGLVVLAQTLFACAFFVLVPARVAFPPVVPGSWAGPMLAFVEMTVLRHNLFPSLHVAFAVTCAVIYARRWYWVWAVAIAASTVLTHQHHVADVVFGWALGLFATRAFYARWAA